MNYEFQQQFLHSDFLQLFHKKLILIQLKSKELFPQTLIDIRLCPKFLVTNEGVFV